MPAFSNVTGLVWPLEMSPESNVPWGFEVAVCLAVSWFVKEILLPTLTSIVGRPNLKSLMSTLVTS